MIAAVLLAASVSAAPAPSGWTPEPRKILALYQKSRIPGEFKDVYYHQLHQHAELPLNHLGLQLEWVDADKPLPADFSGARGVITWFTEPRSFENPAPVCSWLSRAMSAGLKVAVLNELGLYSGSSGDKLVPQCAQALRELGIQARGQTPVDAMTTAVVKQDPIAAFERKPDPSERGTVPLVQLLPGATAHLRLSLDGAPLPFVEPVAVTPRGGIALYPFALYWTEEEPKQYAWIVDPFAFFEEVFALRGLPRPDPTTLSGRRVFFSHVDGDGFFNMSELDRRKTSGEIFLRELVEPMADSPFTLSLIAGYYDLTLYNDAASLALSRRLLTRANVEPASHAYSHPLIWRTMKPALVIPRYTPESRREVVGSTEQLDRLFMPRGKKIDLFLWTGDCLPSEDDVRYAREAGLLQMNGGGGRYDKRHPSVAYLLPLSRQVGRERQIYAPEQNENEYTNLWNGPYYGYRDVLDTFERTGAPRRLKPVDVYVHYYSAEKYASLGALKGAYAWARSQPLVPVFASRYAKAAGAFFGMKISRRGPRRFLLEGGRALRTVRFDREKGAPDLAQSSGVLGWRREGEALYVALDDSDRRELVLADAEKPGVRLEQASFEVEDWKPAAGGVTFRKKGWWGSECELAGLQPRRAYVVQSAGWSARLTADAAGRLKIVFPSSERERPAEAVSVRPA